MSRQLFGTDGIRGVAGEFPLDRPTVSAFGMALGEWVAAKAREEGIKEPAVVIGMDTRESSTWLAEQVAGGLASAKVNARFAGLTTTPAVAYLTRSEDFVAGVMISASHNPFQDNGLKVFDHSGYKLADEAELRLEGRIFELREREAVAAPLALEVDEGLDRRYLNYLAGTCGTRFEGMRIVLDCAHGAASYLAPELFRHLGAEVIPVGCAPDGRNINDGVGALHTEHLRKQVLENGAHAGAAFDGDADRCMLVSSTGRLIDGDMVLLIMAKHLLATQRLNGHNGEPAVVATVMSNLGLERALRDYGIHLVRTAVGDKYVLEEMRRSGLPLGGEQSGHVIMSDYATTGDGLLTALRVLETAALSGRSLDELTAEFVSYPQLLKNVRFRVKRPLEELATVQAEINAARSELGDSGRVLVRFSGTEPLARVMVEGPDRGRVEHLVARIASAISNELNA